MEIVDAVCWFRCPDCWRCVEKDIEMLRDFACFEYCCTNCCAVSVVLFVDFFYILSLYILYTYLEIRLKEIYSSSIRLQFLLLFFLWFSVWTLKKTTSAVEMENFAENVYISFWPFFLEPFLCSRYLNVYKAGGIMFVSCFVLQVETLN